MVILVSYPQHRAKLPGHSMSRHMLETGKNHMHINANSLFSLVLPLREISGDLLPLL